MATATGKLFSAVQNHDIFSTVDRYQFPDPGDIHDYRTVNAHEMRWIEPLSNSRNGFSKEVGVSASIETNIVGRGLDPVNLVLVQEHYVAVCADNQALVQLWSRPLLAVHIRR